MSEITLGRYTTTSPPPPPPPPRGLQFQPSPFFIIAIQTVFYLQAPCYSIQQNVVMPTCVQKKEDLEGKNKCLVKKKSQKIRL